MRSPRFYSFEKEEAFGKFFKTGGRSFCIERALPAHNKDMRREKRKEESPTDEMIRGNKDEAESTLRLWGKKARRHLLPNDKKAK